jgi:hypothetical protein
MIAIRVCILCSQTLIILVNGDILNQFQLTNIRICIESVHITLIELTTILHINKYIFDWYNGKLLICFTLSIKCGVCKKRKNTKCRGRARGSRVSSERAILTQRCTLTNAFKILHYIFLILVWYCDPLSAELRSVCLSVGIGQFHVFIRSYPSAVVIAFRVLSKYYRKGPKRDSKELYKTILYKYLRTKRSCKI